MVGVTCIMYDISAQKAVERRLQESKEAAEEAVRMKSLFLANMAMKFVPQ